MTRDHIATELRDGTDHHILTGLLTVESQSSPVFRDCLIENSLGHGLLIRDSSPLFESTRIVGSVFYNIFLTDRAAPTFPPLLDFETQERMAFSAGQGLAACLRSAF